MTETATKPAPIMPSELRALVRTPVPKRAAFDAANYQDGDKTLHRMEGTVVPPASSRRNVTKITKGTVYSSPGMQGVTFDVNKPLPYNVVDLDSGRTIHVTPEDHAIMTKVNQEAVAKGEPTITFEQLDEMKMKIKVREEMEAEAAEKQAEAPVEHTPQQVELEHPPEPEMPGLMTPNDLPARRRPKRQSVSAMEAGQARIQAAKTAASQVAVLPLEDYIEAKLSAKPATEKVRFSGAFGALSVVYNTVRRDGICLIMTQYSQDEAFYEAPSGREPITVEYKGAKYQCYPGPQFSPFDGIGVRVSLFFIDEA